MLAPMRHLTLLLLALLACAAAFAQEHPLRALNIEFGIKDHEPIAWDGSVSIDKGEIVELRGYRFKDGESIGPNNAWVARTDPWVRPTGGMHPSRATVSPLNPGPRLRSPALLPGTEDATVSVKTVHGDFFFKPSTCPPRTQCTFLATKVEAAQGPPCEGGKKDELRGRLFSHGHAGDGALSMAWIGYRDENDQIFVRDRTDGSWGAILQRGGSLGRPTGLAWQAMVEDGTTPTWFGKADAETGTCCTQPVRWVVERSEGCTLRALATNIFPAMASDPAWRPAPCLAIRPRGVLWDLLQFVRWIPSGPMKSRSAIRGRLTTCGTRHCDPSERQRVGRLGQLSGGGYNIACARSAQGRPRGSTQGHRTPRYHGTRAVAVDPEVTVWVSYDESEEKLGQGHWLPSERRCWDLSVSTNRVVIWNGSEWRPRSMTSTRRFRPACGGPCNRETGP